jgi:glutathione peroxidase
MTFHDLSAKTLDGQTKRLADYAGKVALVVNTASECGYTPQYAGLEQLWRAFRDRGLVVLGFPSNDFGAQEPGSEAQIQTFCSTTYDVTFPMFAKVKVVGAGRSPVFELLAARGEPKWNFHKYLVDRAGNVIEAFPSRVKPEDAELRAAIERALAAPAA